MRKLVTMIVVLLTLSAIAATTAAELKWSFDSRLRPRFDTRDGGDFGNDIDDYYTYYRARLNLKGDLGDGWFGHVRLGTNGFAYWTGKFGDPNASGASKPSGSVSVDGASRGPVDFMLIYFGRKTKEFGYMGGLIPINALANPVYDVHYYSHRMIDVPYFLFSNNGAHGWTGYLGFDKGKVNLTLLADNNEGRFVEDPDGNVVEDTHDAWSVIVDAPIMLGETKVQPVVMAAIADAGMDAPITFGANVVSPKVGQFTFSGTGALSMQRAGSPDQEYDVWYVRAKTVGKAGPGTITAWVDLANKTWDQRNNGAGVEQDFLYWWLSYTIPVYKSDKGSVTIKPTWRHIHDEIDGSRDFTREKIEITIDFKFK